MKLAGANANLVQAFVIINKDGMKINADVNAKNWLTKGYVIKDLIGILAIVNGSVINHVMLENIFKNCKCRKRLVDKLVDECSENSDEMELHQNKMIYNSTLNDYEKICSSCERSSCTIYIVIFVIFFIISVSISSVFIYFHWHLKKYIYIEKTISWILFCWTYKWEILIKLILKIIHITYLMIWLILKTLIQA